VEEELSTPNILSTSLTLPPIPPPASTVPIHGYAIWSRRALRAEIDGSPVGARHIIDTNERPSKILVVGDVDPAGGIERDSDGRPRAQEIGRPEMLAHLILVVDATARRFITLRS